MLMLNPPRQAHPLVQKTPQNVKELPPQDQPAANISTDTFGAAPPKAAFPQAGQAPPYTFIEQTSALLPLHFDWPPDQNETTPEKTTAAFPRWPKPDDAAALCPRKTSPGPKPLIVEEHRLRKQLLARYQRARSATPKMPPYAERLQAFEKMKANLDSFLQACDAYVHHLPETPPSVRAQLFPTHQLWTDRLAKAHIAITKLKASGGYTNATVDPLKDMIESRQAKVAQAALVLREKPSTPKPIPPKRSAPAQFPSPPPPVPEYHAFVRLHQQAIVDLMQRCEPTHDPMQLDPVAAHSDGESPRASTPPTLWPPSTGVSETPGTSWIRDLTADGDVEANPGPDHPMAEGGPPQTTAPETCQPLSFQELAPQFSNFTDLYAPRTLQLPDGRWFEQRPFPPPCLFTIAEEVGGHPVQTFFSGDGLDNPLLPPDLQIFDLASQHQISASALKGKHTFVFLPRPLPFTDSPAAYSLRSWCLLLKEALHTPSPSHPTRVTLAFQSRFTSPTPTALPILDRRFELEMLRKFLCAIRVLPDCRLLHRHTDDGSIYTDRLPTPFPILVFFYSSACSFSPKVTCEIWPALVESPDLEPDPAEVAVLVILNVLTPSSPSSAGPGRAITGMRLLMLLNGMGLDESSTNFRNCSKYRYPPDFVPIVQRATPVDYTIAHYHVPPEIVQQLQEDTDILRETGIEWGIMNAPLTGTLIVSHDPKGARGGGKPARYPSPEVRDSLLAIPAIAKLLECTLLLNKWDVWVRPCDGIALDIFAAQLRNLDDLSVTDAAQLLRVQGPKGAPVASPPDVLVSFPARLLPRTVLGQLSQLFPVISHQPTQRPGLLLLRVPSQDVAVLLYGAVLSTPVGSITLTSGTDAGDTQYEQLCGLERGAPWEARLPLLRALDLPGPSLTSESLLGLAASSTQHGTATDIRPRKVPAIFSKPPPPPSIGASGEPTLDTPMQEN